MLFPIIGQKRFEVEVLLANQEIRVIVEILRLETRIVAIPEQTMSFLDEMNLGSIRHFLHHLLVT